MKIASASARVLDLGAKERPASRGFIVVSQSWSAFISPRPLKRWTVTFLAFSFLIDRVALLLGLGVVRLTLPVLTR